tara:strand:+ start:249 stop:917 length:669 start_codon:yes stop_codon:yes gene_type:complete
MNIKCKIFALLLLGLMQGSTSLWASPFLGISPMLVKPQVKGHSSDSSFGISVRGGYEFLSSRYFLSGHAIEVETGFTYYSFDSGYPGTNDISTRMIPLFANYRFTQYFGSSASDLNGMEYWSPDFILYVGAGLGGVHVSGSENPGGPVSIDFSQVNVAAQFFLGLGIGFTEHLSLTTGYRHIFMNDVDTEGQLWTGMDTSVRHQSSYDTSFHILDLNLRWLW